MRTRLQITRWMVLLLAVTAAGCSTSIPTPAATTTAHPSPAVPPSATAAPTGTTTASPSPLPPTVPPALSICSPLEGYTLQQLPGIVSNPYNPPAPSRDDPHQGVDLAVIDPASGIALEGRPVHTALGGQVALVIRERFPYGNAVLVEVPLETLPAAWAGQPAIPPPAPTITPHPALTCPPVDSVRPPQTTRRSLYFLYAHLQQTANLQPGETLACGQEIGTVGMTGNALNPHLHLEIRVGPSGTRLDGMAHYDPSASPEEMAAYCLWRVSGAFQRIDPLQLLLSNPGTSPAP